MGVSVTKQNNGVILVNIKNKKDYFVLVFFLSPNLCWVMWCGEEKKSMAESISIKN